MFVKPYHIFLLSGMIAMLLFPACNGIFEDIYDRPTPETNKQYGFIAHNEQTHTGRIYINTTDCSKWYYLNFKQRSIETKDVGETAPEQWDIAIHRYDAKTHHAQVAVCTGGDFSTLPPATSLPEESFVSDIWTTDRIAVDMSQMIEGIVHYAEDFYNPCLSGWLHEDISTMPPVYTLSGKNYLIRLSDGTYAAVRLINFMNDAAVKGYITIDYYYPAKP